MFLSVILPISTKFFAEMASEKYGINEVERYASYFASVSNWISGATVPIFTLASVVLLFITLHMQREELELQREELSETRKEFQEQNKTMSLQRFENTFFNLITNYNEILRNIHFENTISSYEGEGVVHETHEGRDGIRFLKYLVYHDINEYLEKKGKVNESKLIEFIDCKINQVVKEFGYGIDHYYKNFLSILIIIYNDKELSPEQKSMYFNLFLSMVSSDEKYLLYCICWSDYGFNLMELMLHFDPDLLTLVEFDEVKVLNSILEEKEVV